jgi:hypothetical protein
MDSEIIEVRAISRAVAVLAAIVVATLVSTTPLPGLEPTPGLGQAASVMIVRKKPQNDMALASAALSPSSQASMAFKGAEGPEGFGQDLRLWVNGPGGELVFLNADRFERCQIARAQRLEQPDCPSADDPRRMVLDTRA